jgi:type I restriction enzyme, S subunit
VLKAAVTGELTRDWRERHKGEIRETGADLLQRILKARRAAWEATELKKLRAMGKRPKDDRWKQGYKEPEPPDTTGSSDLPDGWGWVRWKQVGYCQNGRAFPSSEYQTSGIKLLRPGNLHTSGRVEWTVDNTRYLGSSWRTRHPNYIIGPNELVVNLTAQSLRDEFLRRICVTNPQDSALLNQRIARLTPVIIDRRFCLWIFKSSLFRNYVDRLNTGSLIQHMFTNQIDGFCFPLPPLLEQDQLVSITEEQLSSCEKIEEAIEYHLEYVRALRQSILKAAFAGRLVPQDPDDEPASVLLERIRADRSASAKPARGRRRQRGDQLEFGLERDNLV